MKRLIFILIIILVTFIGCTSNNTNSSNKNIDDNSTKIPNNNESTSKNRQQYSFGPMADLSKINDETKTYLQDLLNKLGDSKEEQITFNIIDATFQEDGALIVDLFVRNGYSYSIGNINFDLKIVQNEKVIASANFQLDEEEFGILSSNDSRPWSILFYPEDVINSNDIKINEVTIEAVNIQFEHIEPVNIQLKHIKS